MGVLEFFKQFNYASVIFDPVPSYGGYWTFKIDNLLKNSKKENGVNLFEKFYEETLIQPLIEIFKTKEISNFKIGLESKENSNKIGRCLRYSKVDFFVELTLFLNQYIDIYGKSEEQQETFLKELVSHIDNDNDTLNMIYSDALKEKCEKLKSLIKEEINSEYFDLAMKDYAPYKNSIDFTTYITKQYEFASSLQKGMIELGDFFDRNIDYNAIYETFEPDTFFLLFAKIIYEINNVGVINNNYGYLHYYNKCLQEILKNNNNYQHSILFIGNDGKKIKYSSNDFKIEFENLLEKHPEANNFEITNFEHDNAENYKDISLMEKLNKLNNNSNWKFLLDDEYIKKSNVYNDTNLRINILEKSGFIKSPVKGLNNFEGYYAFIYSNGKVVLEKFWDDEIEFIPSLSITYVMDIDEFIKLLKSDDINIVEYLKTSSLLKRIFHTSINNWQRNLYNEINGTYRLEDALNFIESLKGGNNY